MDDEIATQNAAIAGSYFQLFWISFIPFQSCPQKN